ncbi:MAG: NUDIX hydrolase [Candidatus Riflebacteria bacterium]|nr:NUDIX hydrolase [Candidatus Riflebacteria bacterium]
MRERTARQGAAGQGRRPLAAAPDGPSVTTADGRRRFPCFPAAVVVFLVNEREEFLLLAHPARHGWEVINGGLDAGLTILDGALKETREEAGPQVKARPIGVVHASSFHYDENVRFMISVSYVMAYEGGPIEPGDDMAGSRFRWAGLAELESGAIPLLVPTTGPWLFRRALEVFRLWQDRRDDPLQRDLTTLVPNKYTIRKDRA